MLVGVIVVGVDGSESSRDALAWALAEARLRDVPVRVIGAWHVEPMAYGAPGFVPPIEGGISESFRRSAERAVAATIEALGQAAKDVRVEQSIVEGAPTQVLVEAAKDADLLVVGSRGHGSFAGLLLGSVSQQSAQHAPCPVVIVRHQAQSAD